MTHKIAPISYRLGVSTSWLSLYHSQLPLLSSDSFLRNLIKGAFLKAEIYTSPIIIKRSINGHLDIHLFFWDSTPSNSPYTDLFGHSSIRSDLFKLIRKASSFSTRRGFDLKFSKKVIISSFLFLFISKCYNIKPSHLKFHFSELPSPVLNATILCDYLSHRISLDPYYHKPLLVEALKASSSF